MYNKGMIQKNLEPKKYIHTFGKKIKFFKEVTKNLFIKNHLLLLEYIIYYYSK